MATEGVLGGGLGPPERQGAIVGGTEGEGWDHQKSFFPSECSQATGHRLQELQGWVQVAAAIVGSRGEQGSQLRDP